MLIKSAATGQFGRSSTGYYQHSLSSDNINGIRVGHAGASFAEVGYAMTEEPTASYSLIQSAGANQQEIRRTTFQADRRFMPGDRWYMYGVGNTYFTFTASELADQLQEAVDAINAGTEALSAVVTGGNAIDTTWDANNYTRNVYFYRSSLAMRAWVAPFETVQFETLPGAKYLRVYNGLGTYYYSELV